LCPSLSCHSLVLPQKYFVADDFVTYFLSPRVDVEIGVAWIGKIRFMPPQLREIGCHVENHATQWYDFQHEIQFQEIGVAWIQLTLLVIRAHS
jgi:hypothetical protein